MTDLSQFDNRPIESAKRSDFSLLADKLRNSKAALNDVERKYIADVLEKKVKLRRGPKRALQPKDIRIFLVVNWLVRIEGCKVYIAREEAAKIFGMSEKTIRNRLKEYEKNPPCVWPEVAIRSAEQVPEFRNGLKPSELRE